MKKNKSEESYKFVLVITLILILIIGGAIYFNKLQKLDRTIQQIQEHIPKTIEYTSNSNTLIDKNVLLNALSEEELKSNFPSIVKNVYGYDVEYRCDEYNDVDGCNRIFVDVKTFQLK